MSDICIHCGRPFEGYAHMEGDYRGKQRCSPGDSGLQYGYNAHPVGTPCERPCLGEVYPDTGPWRDRQGDVWGLGEDGLLWTRETMPFPRYHIVKKWGPLVPVEAAA